jgi:hypothetical protein
MHRLNVYQRTVVAGQYTKKKKSNVLDLDLVGVFFWFLSYMHEQGLGGATSVKWSNRKALES